MLLKAVPRLWQSVTGHVRVLSVFLCVSETHAQLLRWLNLQRESGRHIPQHGRDPVSLRWAPAAEQEVPGLQRLEKVADPKSP